MTIHNPRALQHAEVPNPPQAFCDGKVCFDGPNLAWKVAKGRKSRGQRVAYYCENCRSWHVGAPR